MRSLLQILQFLFVFISGERHGGDVLVFDV